MLTSHPFEVKSHCWSLETPVQLDRTTRSPRLLRQWLSCLIAFVDLLNENAYTQSHYVTGVCLLNCQDEIIMHEIINYVLLTKLPPSIDCLDKCGNCTGPLLQHTNSRARESDI